MGILFFSASQLFKDFQSEVLEYNILDNGSIIGSCRGLYGDDEGGQYIGFLMSDQPKIAVGNTICTTDNLESFTIRHISYDRYNGKAELLKAYY